MRGRPTLAVIAALSSLAALIASCSGPELVILRSTSRVQGNGGSSTGGTGGATITFPGGTAGSTWGFGGANPDCVGLDCNQLDCPNGAGGKTSVSGTVFDPAGRVPLYNVVVYVPNKMPLDPVPENVQCSSCETPIAGAIAATLSQSDGTFQLLDVPPGNDIPVVIQIGKWQRLITVPRVEPCVDTPIGEKYADGSEALTRLPRNTTEGRIPQIGLTTGHADALECLLRKIGIDDSEFTTDSGPGRVHMYVGCANTDYTPPRTGANRFAPELGSAGFATATSLYADPAKLSRYDMLVFSCEGTQCTNDKSDYVGNIKGYADSGGKLFLEHTHYYWLRKDPIWATTADYVGANAPDLPDPFPLAKIEQTKFPKGEAFADWLVTVGASATRGSLTIYGGQFTYRDTYPPLAQRWIYTDQNPVDASGHAVEYMTLNTPVENAGGGGAGGAVGAAGAAGAGGGQCGRIVYTDLHVNSVVNETSDQDTPFPRGCLEDKPALTAQEKALEFMIFDLSSCVQAERKVPTLPVQIIK